MRHNNTVGGFRIHPASPTYAQIEALHRDSIDQINDGLDLLSQAKMINQRQYRFIQNLDVSHPVKISFYDLIENTNRLFDSAQRRRNIPAEQTSTNTISNANYLASQLRETAGQWRHLKTQLSELMPASSSTT